MARLIDRLNAMDARIQSRQEERVRRAPGWMIDRPLLGSALCGIVMAVITVLYGVVIDDGGPIWWQLALGSGLFAMFLTYVLFSREKESRRAATRDVPPLPPAGDPATTGRFPLFHKLDARLEGVVDRRQARSMPRVPGWMIKVPIVFGVGIGLIFALPNALLRLAMHHPPDGLTWLGLGIGAATFAIVGTAFAVREKRRRAARSQLPLG